MILHNFFQHFYIKLLTLYKKYGILKMKKGTGKNQELSISKTERRESDAQRRRNIAVSFTGE